MTQMQDVSTDWRKLLDSWDQQQTGYLPYREERFTAMLDVLAAVLPDEFVAVDLACGPGSLGERLLNRFPSARCIAVDVDPVLVELGRRALGDTYGDRLRFVEADIAQADLRELTGADQIDAVLSTTALHWLAPDRLVGLYERLAAWIRPGGVLLNGDNIPYARQRTPLQEMAETARARYAMAAFGEDMHSGWVNWWQSAAQEPVLAALVEERERRLAEIPREHAEPTLEFHLGALRNAGFSLVDTVWQKLDDRVIAALR